MTVTPYTQKRYVEHRGPHSSQQYNERIEEQYRDQIYLYNTAAQTRVDLDSRTSVLFKQLQSLIVHLESFDARLEALEQQNSNLVFYSDEQIDNDRFDGTPFEIINDVDKCTWHPNFCAVTLPYVADSSLSKIRYFNDDGSFSVANGLEVLVTQVAPSADDSDAVVETSSPYDAIQGKTGLAWERNVLSPTTEAQGAQCYLYVRIPNDLSVTADTNGILFTPMPVFDVDILEMAYSTDPNVALAASANWTVFNSGDWYMNNAEAVGHLPPGAWIGDELVDCGPKLFYFEPKAITAVRFKLKQNTYYTRASNKYLYTYGLNNLDIRYDKFLNTGKFFVRLDAPLGDVINDIESVTPKIWNVSQSDLNNVFSYRVIWETSFNSGNYTLTPVSASQRVWLEITLNQVVTGFTPLITSIIANYT